MPLIPEACARPRTSVDPDFGVDVEAGKDIEGKGEQRVAGKNRGCLVEGLVDGGQTAAQIVVVHRRKVVMDEAVAMHAFKRGRGFDDQPAGLVEKAGALDQQKRPYALAAAERCVTHGGKQAVRPNGVTGAVAGRQKPLEGCLSGRGDRGEAGLESLAHRLRLGRKRRGVKPGRLRRPATASIRGGWRSE